MDLAVVTPTRNRWGFLLDQAKALVPQLADGDSWIVVCDCNSPPAEAAEELAARVGRKLVWLDLAYPRERFGWSAPVNRARNIGGCFATTVAHCIVELDDHDTIAAGAIELIRGAIEDGADYVFGNYQQRALIPIEGGRTLLEGWPDKCHDYQPGAFARGFPYPDAIGMRAFRWNLWEALHGWNPFHYPGGDQDFARRAEELGREIRHLPVCLCTVTIDPDSIMGENRLPEGVEPCQEGQPAAAATSTANCACDAQIATSLGGTPS